jgi:hypothetical protein
MDSACLCMEMLCDERMKKRRDVPQLYVATGRRSRRPVISEIRPHVPRVQTGRRSLLALSLDVPHSTYTPP